MTAWEMIDATLKASGLPDAASLAAMRWVDCAPDFETAHFLNGFPTPEGRFRFKPDCAAIGPAHAGMPPLPPHLAFTAERSPEHQRPPVTAPRSDTSPG